MRRVYKNLCPATISATIMEANMWKNSLKNVEPDHNKILYETVLDFFLQRNATYFLNKPCILLTGIGFKPGGSSIVHFYTQTTHKTTQWNGIQHT